MFDMKLNKLLVIIISAIAVIMICVVSKEATIQYMFAEVFYGTGEGNSDIVFSKNSGFYKEKFMLRIYAPTDEIYYTLDGSDPDRNSLKYERALVIRDASDNPNVYSLRTDVTTRFSEEVEIYCENLDEVPEYKVPDEKIDKCNVVKVVYYDQNGNKSKVAERVYFIGFNNKSGYERVNVISITTDPNNLFDPETGIYTTGNIFEDFSRNELSQNYEKKNEWEHWKANYHQRGREWEREGNIKIFDSEKKIVLSQTSGIRIQGGMSRGIYPKSLNLYARDEYGENRFDYDIWGTGYKPKRMTLTCGGNDYYTKIRDRLASELVKDTEIATMNYEPYVLFLNGEYWGFYYLTEKYDAQFVEYYYGINRGDNDDNIIIIKNGKIEVGTEEDQYGLYNTMVQFIEENDMSIDENYKKACELMDMNSFIDYFAVECYIARRGDWPKSNYALWRSRNVSNRPYEDGKWRWMLFDVNSRSMKSHYYYFDYIKENRKNSDMFDSLCENEEFRHKFSERIVELSNTVFEKEYVNQKITQYVELMDQPMKKHFQRFFGTSNELFHSEIEDIRYFYNERKPYIAETIEFHFGEEYLGETVQ